MTEDKERSSRQALQELWHRDNTELRSWLVNCLVQDQLQAFYLSDQQLFRLQHDGVDINDVNALKKAVAYAQQQSRLYKEQKTRSPAITIATVRAYVDAAREAEQKGLSKTIVNQDGKRYELYAGDTNAYIVGCTAAAYRAGFVDLDQVKSMTDGIASNNWDLLIASNEWIGLEALANTAMHFPHSGLAHAITELKSADKESLVGLTKPTYDSTTRFAATTNHFVRQITAQYATQSLTRGQVDQIFGREKEHILRHKRQGMREIRYANGSALSILEAYSFLTALTIYQKTLSY